MSQSRERYVPGRKSGQEKCEKRELFSRQTPCDEENQHERYDAEYRGRKPACGDTEAGHAHRDSGKPRIHGWPIVDVTQSAKDNRVANA